MCEDLYKNQFDAELARMERKWEFRYERQLKKQRELHINGICSILEHQAYRTKEDAIKMLELRDCNEIIWIC